MLNVVASTNSGRRKTGPTSKRHPARMRTRRCRAERRSAAQINAGSASCLIDGAQIEVGGDGWAGLGGWARRRKASARGARRMRGQDHRGFAPKGGRRLG